MSNTKIMPVEDEAATMTEAAVIETPTGNENENSTADANEPLEELRRDPTGTEAVKEQSRQQQPTASAAVDTVTPSQDEFVNNGLARWLATREAWCGNGAAKKNSTGKGTVIRKASPIDVDGVIDVLFDPRWRGGGRVKVSLVPPRFPTNVPLPQMIDVLTDLWEAEGLDV